MSSYIGILILCGVPGISAGLFHIFLTKQVNAEGRINAIAVYIGLFYGILSFIQTILGSGHLTLPESFHDAVPTTYLFYLLPLMMLSFIVPLLVKLLSRYADIAKFFALFASVMFTILALWFIVFNRIHNSLYAAVLAISALVAFWGINYYKGEITFFAKDDVKRRIQYAVPATLFYVVTAMISLPGTLFLNNRSEMSFSAASFAAALMIGAVIQAAVIGGVGIVLLTRRQFDWVYTVLFALTLSGYLQNILLNGQMDQMDGGRQVWQGARLYINFIIWIVLIAGIVLIKRLVHKDVAKIYSAICIYLSLVQAVSLGYLAVRTTLLNPEDSDEQWVLSTDGYFTLHPTDNVLVFVLDWYDEQILEKVLQENEQFLSPLDGFTRYTNTTSLYAFTAMSIPYFLSGVEWQYEMSRDEYVKYAYENSTMLSDISSAGYDIGIYTDSSYVCSDIAGYLRNCVPYSQLSDEQHCDTWSTIELMSRCSKYQMAPFGIKNWYWYSSDEINALRGNNQIIHDVYDDFPFWTALSETGLSIDENATGSGSYRLYHLYGVHPPYRMSENFTDLGVSLEAGDMMSQAKGSMKIVLEYIEQLKELDLYDRTTIIITADHGQQYMYVPSREQQLASLGMEKTSTPILLVKMPGDTWSGIKQSGAPVSHAEMVASIANALTPPQKSSKYGRTLQEIDETEERVRTFIFWRSDLPYVKSTITGNARDVSSWSIVERIEPEDR